MVRALCCEDHATVTDSIPGQSFEIGDDYSDFDEDELEDEEDEEDEEEDSRPRKKAKV